MTTYAEYLPNRLISPRGLENTGNICWLNALCQFLLSLDSFNRMIIDVPKQSGAGMRAAWQIFLKTGNQTKLRQEFSKRLSAGQQCADEALGIFLESLNHGVSTNMLRIIMNTYTRCNKCGKQEKHRELAHRVVIYPPPRPLLESLRENHSALSGFSCECGEAYTHRVESLGRVENALMITFQQYETRYLYQFPEILEIPSIDGPSHRFELMAQIEHSGNQFSGHYTARVRREGGIFHINDTVITPSRFESTPFTYMLAYFRIP